MNDLISIIIPVYNKEKEIRKCLDSIINQTYKNIEIIIINDGSKDNCKSICQEYASRDSRIVFIHKENEGVSKTRNMGLDIAKGDFITFVDSDDYIDFDGIYNSYSLFSEEIDVVCLSSYKNDSNFVKKINSIDSIMSMLSDRGFGVSIWNKLYRKGVIGNIRFDNKVAIGEDLDFLYKVLKRANLVIYSSKNYYNQVISENNSDNTSSTKQKMVAIDIYQNILNDSDDKKTKKYCKANIVDTIIHIIWSKNFAINDKKVVKFLNKKLRKYLFVYVFSNKYKIITRLVAISFALFPRITLNILKKMRDK